MTLNKYQFKAARTINRSMSIQKIVRHSLLEMSSEVGEICGIYQKQMQGHPVNKDDLIEEIGDLLWGIAEICTANGFFLDEVAKANIKKLRARYPDGFDPERSLHREKDR